jgi:hypothetical protein
MMASALPALAQVPMTEEQAQMQLQMATINYQRVLMEKQQRSIVDWQKTFAAWCGARPACGLTASPAAQSKPPLAHSAPNTQSKLPLGHSVPNDVKPPPGVSPKR